MGNVPPEYEAMIAAAEAELAKVSTQKKSSAVLKMVYKELVQRFIDSGADPEKFNAYLTVYTAEQLMRVVGAVQSIAKRNKPTHRKGRGTDGGRVVQGSEDWIFPFDRQGGEDVPPGDADEGPDEGGGGFLDWAPPDEIDRAKAMLVTVASEMHFGEDDDPLPFIREVARRLGGRWGLNGKRGNANDPSSDILAWNIPGMLPQAFDVLRDAGGENRIVWQPLSWGGKSVWIKP